MKATYNDKTNHFLLEDDHAVVAILTRADFATLRDQMTATLATLVECDGSADFGSVLESEAEQRNAALERDVAALTTRAEATEYERDMAQGRIAILESVIVNPENWRLRKYMKAYFERRLDDCQARARQLQERADAIETVLADIEADTD